MAAALVLARAAAAVPSHLREQTRTGLLRCARSAATRAGSQFQRCSLQPSAYTRSEPHLTKASPALGWPG